MAVGLLSCLSESLTLGPSWRYSQSLSDPSAPAALRIPSSVIDDSGPPTLAILTSICLNRMKSSVAEKAFAAAARRVTMT